MTAGSSSRVSRRRNTGRDSSSSTGGIRRSKTLRSSVSLASAGAGRGSMGSVRLSLLMFCWLFSGSVGRFQCHGLRKNRPRHDILITSVESISSVPSGASSGHFSTEERGGQLRQGSGESTCAALHCDGSNPLLCLPIFAPPPASIAGMGGT